MAEAVVEFCDMVTLMVGTEGPVSASTTTIFQETEYYYDGGRPGD